MYSSGFRVITISITTLTMNIAHDIPKISTHLLIYLMTIVQVM